MFDIAFIESLPRFITPVLLAALGGAMCTRAGVFNIALEGMMLVGAFAAMLGSYLTANWLGGVSAGVIAGAAMGALFALFSVYRKGDDIVVSIGINILAVGITAFALRAIFDVKGAFDDPRIVAIPRINIPLIEDIPGVGALVSGQSLLSYVAMALLVIIAIGLARHRFGLRIRAAGENPAALASVGVDPKTVRAITLVICGVLCGLAGAQLSIFNVTLFTENMSAGRGWIAVAIVLMASGRPWPLFFIAVLFGSVDVLSFRIQGLGWPQQITDAMPYVTALVVLCVTALRQKRAKAWL